MLLANASHAPSRAEFGRASRLASRLEAKDAAYSVRPASSPGRTYLELRLATAYTNTSRVVGLTQRDVAILRALDSYRYLDRHQIQGLFFEGQRSCQYRLKWLADHGLINAWRAVIRPGHVRTASIFLLSNRGASALAGLSEDEARPYVQRAEHALTRHHHLVHDLEANQLFVDLAVAARHLPTLGLYHWVGEHGIRRAYGEEAGPVADGWGRFLIGERELFLHLELDRGSEQTRRLHAKVAAYLEYFRGRPQASCNHVLFVVPTEQRQVQVWSVARRLVETTVECCRVWTAVRQDLALNGPLSRVWVDFSDSAGRVSIPDMPSRPAGIRPLTDCIGKSRWWERRPSGGDGV